MRRKQIEKGKTYTNGKFNRKVLHIFTTLGEVKYRITKKQGRGRGVLGGVYRCCLQTFANWAKNAVHDD